jgi:hypothetical protein
MSGQEPKQESKKEEDFFTILVQDTSGNEETLSVLGSHKISQLKTILSVKKGLNIATISLLYGGKPLDNEKTLAECNILKNCKILMMHRIL